MSAFQAYKTKTFSANQKFFVLDPNTGSPSFVQGSDLVSQLTPNSNYVYSEATRTTAQATDYAIGSLIQTAGDLTAGDNFAGTFLVVPGGDGDFPMANGNDLLIIRGDVLLREQLASNTATQGSALVAHTGTNDTVTEALDKRTVFVGSVAELSTTSGLSDESVVQTTSFWPGENVGGNSYKWKPGTSKTLHNGISIIDPDKIAQLISPGSFGTYFSAAASGSGCFISTISDFNLHVTHAGAVKEVQSWDAINAYALYMTDKGLEIDVTGGPYYFNQTLDLTLATSAICKFKGDCEDQNTTGIYNLVYTPTTGVAINCDEIIHTKLGLAGTVSVVDTIPSASVGIQCSQSYTHIDSCIRNFGTLYKPTGGFYSSVNGGRLHRANTLFDYLSHPDGVFNLRVDCRCDTFDDGIKAAAGGGPIIMGGAWEKFTRSCVDVGSFASTIVPVIMDGAYFENYPTSAIAPGLTDVSGTGFYIAPRAIRNSESSVSGECRVYFSGINVFVESIVGITALPLVIGQAGIKALDGPTSIIDAPYVMNSGLRLGIDDSDLVDWASSTAFSTAALQAERTTGDYTDVDGILKTHIYRITSLDNSWAFASGTNVSISSGGSTASVRGILSAAAATLGDAFTLPLEKRPAQAQQFIISANTASGTARVRINTSGIVNITEQTGAAISASAIYLDFSYLI